MTQPHDDSGSVCVAGGDFRAEERDPPAAGGLLIGGFETEHLREATGDSFIAGVW